MRRYLCRALTHPCTRAGWLPHSPKVTTMTGMLRRWRVPWDRRKNPYSNEYSTIYSSCGHTAREGGKGDSTAGFANSYQEEIAPLDSLPPTTFWKRELVANTGSRLPSTDLKQINTNSLKLQPIPLTLVLNVKLLRKLQGSGSKLCQALSRICPHLCLASPRPLVLALFNFCFLCRLGKSRKIHFTPAEHQVNTSQGKSTALLRRQRSLLQLQISKLKAGAITAFQKILVPEVSLIFYLLFFLKKS